MHFSISTIVYNHWGGCTIMSRDLFLSVFWGFISSIISGVSSCCINEGSPYVSHGFSHHSMSICQDGWYEGEGFLSHGGTPIYHPMFSGIFHYKPSIFGDPHGHGHLHGHGYIIHRGHNVWRWVSCVLRFCAALGVQFMENWDRHLLMENYTMGKHLVSGVVAY